jgi:hypothetical protein
MVRVCENRPRIPADEFLAGVRRTLISTHLRFAAGVCLLSTGLLIGSAGGGIAAADTESSGSSAQSESADSAGSPSQAASPASGSLASGPVASAGPTFQQTLRENIQRVVTNTLGSLSKPGHEAGLPKPPVTKPETTDVEEDKKDVTTGVTTSVALDSDDVASNSKMGSDSNAVEPKPNVTASVPRGLPAAFDRAEAVSKVIDPVANAVVTVAAVAQAVPGVLAALPTSTTPIADVIASLQTMLTMVGDAVIPLATQLPSDLFTLLVVPGDAPAATGVLGRSYAAGSFTTVVAPAPRPPLPPAALPTPDLSGGPLLGDGAAPVTVADIEIAALSRDFSVSGAETLAPESASPTGVMSFLEHTIKAILVPASLSALAALALPGVAGLLIACGAGMRIGYRQAKAAMTARKSGIARFAGTGPLGVVRSGSLIALRRPRASRGAHSKPSRPLRLADQVA